MSLEKFVEKLKKESRLNNNAIKTYDALKDNTPYLLLNIAYLNEILNVLKSDPTKADATRDNDFILNFRYKDSKNGDIKISNFERIKGTITQEEKEKDGLIFSICIDKEHFKLPIRTSEEKQFLIKNMEKSLESYNSKQGKLRTSIDKVTSRGVPDKNTKSQNLFNLPVFLTLFSNMEKEFTYVDKNRYTYFDLFPRGIGTSFAKTFEENREKLSQAIEEIAGRITKIKSHAFTMVMLACKILGESINKVKKEDIVDTLIKLDKKVQLQIDSGKKGNFVDLFSTSLGRSDRGGLFPGSAHEKKSKKPSRQQPWQHTSTQETYSTSQERVHDTLYTSAQSTGSKTYHITPKGPSNLRSEIDKYLKTLSGSIVREIERLADPIVAQYKTEINLLNDEIKNQQEIINLTQDNNILLLDRNNIFQQEIKELNSVISRMTFDQHKARSLERDQEKYNHVNNYPPIDYATAPITTLEKQSQFSLNPYQQTLTQHNPPTSQQRTLHWQLNAKESEKHPANPKIDEYLFSIGSEMERSIYSIQTQYEAQIKFLKRKINNKEQLINTVRAQNRELLNLHSAYRQEIEKLNSAISGQQKTISLEEEMAAQTLAGLFKDGRSQPNSGNQEGARGQSVRDQPLANPKRKQERRGETNNEGAKRLKGTEKSKDSSIN